MGSARIIRGFARCQHALLRDGDEDEELRRGGRGGFQRPKSAATADKLARGNRVRCSARGEVAARDAERRRRCATNLRQERERGRERQHVSHLWPHHSPAVPRGAIRLTGRLRRDRIVAPIHLTGEPRECTLEF